MHTGSPVPAYLGKTFTEAFAKDIHSLLPTGFELTFAFAKSAEIKLFNTQWI